MVRCSGGPKRAARAWIDARSILCFARAQIKTLSAVFVEKENRIHEKEETNKKIKSECDARAATLSELEQKLEKARAPGTLLATRCYGVVLPTARKRHACSLARRSPKR